MYVTDVVTVAPVTAEEGKRVSEQDVDCGCGPTEAEKRGFWEKGSVSRRSAIGLGALTVAALSTFGVGAGFNAAYAASYPSWDDVQNAKNNEAAKANEIARIQGLISGLTQKVADAQAAARAAGTEYYNAQQAFFEAAQRATDLQAQADAQDALALDSARKAGQVASQIYRNGGDNTSLELFFSSSAASADELLSKLGQMDKLLSRNQAVYDDAVSARNSAQNLSDQAVTARTERDRLQKLAEEKLKAAQEAQIAAEAALAEQQTYLLQLEAQLAALQDDTAKTIADYEAGVAEAKRLEEERIQREKEEAANNPGNGGGNGGGGTGGVGSGNGWVRPHGGYQSSGYGPRVPDCDSSGCSSSFHRGVDLAAGCWAPIYAASSGWVDAAFYNGGYGYWVRIQHGDGISTSYAHIAEGGIAVSYGQWVSAGQVIAYAGNTGASFGCHLHFEVYEYGSVINPIWFMESLGVWMG